MARERDEVGMPRVMRTMRQHSVAFRRGFLSLLCLVTLAGLPGCADKEAGVAPPEYAYSPPGSRVRHLTLGIHPLHNPGRLVELYGPIVDALNAALGDISIRLEASRDYADYERKLRAGSLDLALPNPYQTVIVAAESYRVFGKVMGDEDFHGLILLRRDSPVREVADLRGKRFSCPSRTAVAGCMLPLMHLHAAGLDVARELDVRAVGSQESSILNVARGLVDAGATWPPPWRAFQKDHPEMARGLVVAWTTSSLPNNSLMARRDLDHGVVDRVGQQLFALSESETGRDLLSRAEIAGFEPADDTRYAPVHAMLDRYRAAIGPVRQ